MDPSAGGLSADSWAQAILTVWRGGGWQLCGFIAFIVMCRYPPWRRAKKEE